jgi:aspartyl-tRNA synthetase
MAYADGEKVMAEIEDLIKSLYLKVFSNHPKTLEYPLPKSAFIRMSYEEAMSKHGSDKPDLRINGLVGSPLTVKDLN